MFYLDHFSSTYKFGMLNKVNKSRNVYIKQRYANNTLNIKRSATITDHTCIKGWYLAKDSYVQKVIKTVVIDSPGGKKNYVGTNYKIKRYRIDVFKTLFKI